MTFDPRLPFLAVLILLAAGFTFATWKANKDPHSLLSVVDALTDETTGKTSFVKLIVFGSWVLAWLIALFYLFDGKDVMNYTLALLGVFVTQMAVNRVTENFDPRTKAAAARLDAGQQPLPPVPIAETEPERTERKANANPQ